MDEHQALLGRNVRPSLFSPANVVKTAKRPEFHQAPYDGGGCSSSEGSSSWGEDSHSSCSSCSGSSESSEEDWEDSVTEDGHLVYVEAADNTDRTDESHNTEEEVHTAVQGASPVTKKTFIDKEGKFVRWIRRRESKRQRPRLSVVAEPTSSSFPNRMNLRNVTVEIIKEDGKCERDLLGIQFTEGDGKSAVVGAILSDGPLAGTDKVSVGDVLKNINNHDITIDSMENYLRTLPSVCQVVLGFQKTKDVSSKRDGTQSKLVQRLLAGDGSLHSKYAKQPFGVMVINMAELREETPDSDLVYCYPPQSTLAPGRGAFVTLSHLLPSVVGSDCQSCTFEVKNEAVHMVFSKEDDFLFLVAIPDKVCRVEDACLLTTDMVRSICFAHQTLQCCFRKDTAILHKFFSGFFAQLFNICNSSMPDVPFNLVDVMHHNFHEYLAAAPWVPLPREAQLQLDDALNELESCDFGHNDDDCVESDRQFIVLGSCLYHQAHLLVSHLSKEDLLDVHSYLRVHGLLDLSRSEGVNRMVIWREVFPHSVNRGMPPTTQAAYPPPVGRWFLVIVSTGHDMLVVLLENAGCCIPLPRQTRPNITQVREAEDTLAHIQSLGLTSLAAQWLASQARPRTTATTTHSQRPVPKEKIWANLARPVGPIRNLGTDVQEDTFSQAPSNVSNPSNTSNASESDENAPILGRRAERSGLSNTVAAHSMGAMRQRERDSDDSQSDTSDSDSDWGSFKGLGINDNGGIFDNPYLPSNVGDLDEITVSKITSGNENQLYHFVYIDGNEGVVITPGNETTPPSALMAKFTEAAHNIHAQLQHNVRFRSASDPRGLLNKSLIAVKECGILLNTDPDEKPQWVVGRLFFTPKPREVYVCYSDDAPQNMLELAFRLGLGVAG